MDEAELWEEATYIAVSVVKVSWHTTLICHHKTTWHIHRLHTSLIFLNNCITKHRVKARVQKQCRISTNECEISFCLIMLILQTHSWAAAQNCKGENTIGSVFKLAHTKYFILYCCVNTNTACTVNPIIWTLLVTAHWDAQNAQIIDNCL